MKVKTIISMAKQLKLSSLSISSGIKTGSFCSSFRGHGIEFDSVREYQIEDDVRSIDWNLTARTGKPYVKTYREEHDLNLFLCIDFSNSMNVGKEDNTPREKAIETAALLLFACLNISAPVGGIFFANKQGPIFTQKNGYDHVLSMLKSMEKFSLNGFVDKNTGTDLSSSLKTVSKILRRRSIVIIISDFKVDGFKKELGILASKHDVVCLKIISEFDSRLPHTGSIQFKDAESNLKSLLPTSSKKFQIEYKKKFYEELSNWENICKQCFANPLLLNVTDDTVKILTNFFVSRQNNQHTLKTNIKRIGAEVWKVS